MSAKATGGHGAAKYILTNRFMYFEKGLLSTNSQQFPVATLLDVDVHQSMTQKPRGVGDVTIKIQHGDKLDSLTLESIPDFRNVQRLMNETSHAARTAITQMQNTHHYGSGTPVQTTPTPAVAPAPVPVPSPTPAPAADPMEQLRKLAELRDAGILSTEEFDAKKQEILARM